MDKVFGELNVTDYDTQFLVAIVGFSHSIKDKLPNRKRFVLEARERVKNIETDPKEIEIIVKHMHI